MAPRRKAVYVESIYVERGGRGGYQSVGVDDLPASRFHTTGGAARSVLKALKTRLAPDAAEAFFDIHTGTGAAFRVHLNVEHDELTVAHQCHSDTANDFLDDVGRETGWPNVAAALDALQKAVKDGVLAGEALEERVRSEYIPGLRKWQECLRQRDEWDGPEHQQVTEAVEKAVKLEAVMDGPEPSPLHGVISAILRADDPVAAVLDVGTLVELDYMDIPVALNPLTNADLKMEEISGGETCSKT